MPYSRTRRHVTLRLSHLTTLVVALAVALPFVQPSAAAAVISMPGLKGSGTVEDAFQVRFRPGVSAQDASAILARAHAQELTRVDTSRVRLVTLPVVGRAAMRQQLMSDPRVQSVESDAVVSTSVTPTDPHWRQEWNMRQIRLPEAWQHTRGETSTIIAIVDTGVDPNHPDLRGRFVKGWDFHNNDANPYDDDGHGTAVATTAAAAGNDRVGIAGACWRCKIMPVKVLNGSGHGTHSNLAAGIVWAVKHGADVINMSIAGLGSTTLLRDAVAYAINMGVVVVAAAGNEGSYKRSYPGAYPGVISVAATNPSDRLYSWSNRGSWVTMAAPGCSFSGRPRAKWGWLCGTSLASPIVAGTAALMKSRGPKLGRVRLTQMLTANTQRLRIGLSHGRLDAARALKAVALAFPSQPAPTAKPTPTPTPRRTPTPTPKPTATPSGTPAPPRHGEYEWRGELGGDDQWDRKEFYIRGHVHVWVDWWGGSDELMVYVQHPNGNIAKKAHGYFELDVQGGYFTFTVQQEGSRQTDYRLVIKYGIVE
jgi:subtilisin family serine protease